MALIEDPPPHPRYPETAKMVEFREVRLGVYHITVDDYTLPLDLTDHVAIEQEGPGGARLIKIAIPQNPLAGDTFRILKLRPKPPEDWKEQLAAAPDVETALELTKEWNRIRG